MKVAASITIALNHRITSLQIRNLSEIFESALRYYSYKATSNISSSTTYDFYSNSWLYTFLAHDDRGVMMIKEKFKLRMLLIFNLTDYIGFCLVSDSILAYMTDTAKDKTFYYKNWGTLALEKEINTADINLVRANVIRLTEEYAVFLKSEAILQVADELKIHHDIFLDSFLIVKLDKLAKSAKSGGLYNSSISPYGLIMKRLVEILES